MKVCQNRKVQNAINTDDDNYNKPIIAVVANVEYVTLLMPNPDSTVNNFCTSFCHIISHLGWLLVNVIPCFLVFQMVSLIENQRTFLTSLILATWVCQSSRQQQQQHNWYFDGIRYLCSLVTCLFRGFRGTVSVLTPAGLITAARRGRCGAVLCASCLRRGVSEKLCLKIRFGRIPEWVAPDQEVRTEGKKEGRGVGRGCLLTFLTFRIRWRRIYCLVATCVPTLPMLHCLMQNIVKFSPKRKRKHWQCKWGVRR